MLRIVLTALALATVAVCVPLSSSSTTTTTSSSSDSFDVPAVRFSDFDTDLQFQKGDSVMDFFVQVLEKARSAAEESLLTDFPSLYPRADENNQNGVGGAEPILPERFFRFIPVYVGSAIPNAQQVQSWPAKCFQTNSVVVDKSDASGVQLTFTSNDPTSLLCSDDYLLLTTEGLHFHKISRKGAHTMHWSFHKKTSDLDKQWIQANGVRVFYFTDGFGSSLLDVLSTVELFSPVIIPRPSVNARAARANIKFIKEYANVTMEERTIHNVDIDENLIADGDFLGIIRLDGLDTMQCFGTGAHTGHTAMALRIDGNLYVVESTDKSVYWPKPHIQRTPFSEWIQLARKADYNVRHLPLTKDARAKFNVTAAVDFFKYVEGMPYGYHNFIWGWVDTESGNLPYPLSHQLVEPLFAIVSKIVPAVARMMWDLAFNKRLATDGLDTIQVYSEIAKRNITFGQLISMPEQDSWVYDDGLSMVCDVLVCRLYKEGGLFGDLKDDIQCTEFQNWDVEVLDFFDRNPVRPQQCIDADPELRTCQLMGAYRMHLPDFGTVKPYAHMREKCSALPPKFVRPDGC